MPVEIADIMSDKLHTWPRANKGFRERTNCLGFMSISIRSLTSHQLPSALIHYISPRSMLIMMFSQSNRGEEIAQFIVRIE